LSSESEDESTAGFFVVGNLTFAVAIADFSSSIF